MAVTIQDGKVVSLAYTLTAENELIERATPDEPLDYLHGAENIVPGLEKELTGKKVGDRFTITLQPADAYGEYDEEDIETIAREDLPEGDIEVGTVVLLEDLEDGGVMEATIREINADSVVLDFNQYLAGKTVTYEVEVVAIRDAEEEELEAGQPYGFDDDDYEDFEDEE